MGLSGSRSRRWRPPCCSDLTNCPAWPGPELAASGAVDGVPVPGLPVGATGMALAGEMSHGRLKGADEGNGMTSGCHNESNRTKARSPSTSLLKTKPSLTDELCGVLRGVESHSSDR